MRHPLEDFGSYHAWLQTLDGYEDQIRSFHFFPERAGIWAEPPAPFAGWCERLGLHLYRHQRDALVDVAAGHHLVVATPTASGKSLIYQLPTIRALAGGGTALFLFPTKALAHDQLDKLRALGEVAGIDGIVGYDGDTPRDARAGVRERARCVATNPDMLHYAILPYHERWARFLSRLELVVVDEVHAYRGVLGIHTANILRRLLRLARHYGATPQFIGASATIGNPVEHVMSLAGIEPHVVLEDTAPRAPREFIFWQPPAVSGGDGRRRSPNTEAADLAAAFVRRGVKSIFFCNSRKGAELVHRYAAGTLGADAARLMTYRGGYAAEDRRIIEQGFRDGDITVLTATSALELGVDVGGVDAVVMVGYPGSKMALWQRTGRAGRAERRSLALLIPGNDPLDEYYLHHPELLTEGSVEDAVADPFNHEIHPLHLRCAAAELPLTQGESVIAPALELATVPGLVETKRGWAQHGAYPHRRIAVRGTGGKRIRLRSVDGDALGIADLATALRDLHPGAVYLHQGEPYLVVSLNLDAGVAELLPHIEDWYTQVRSETEIEILSEEVSLLAGPGLSIGRVRVTTHVTGYVRKRYISEAVLEERLLDLPPTSYATQALWFDATDASRGLPPGDVPSALHALEHTLIGLLPVFVLCDRADVGGVSYPAYPPTGRQVVFIYDGYPGGVGYAHAGATVFRRWLAAATDLLASCPCASGCPRCVLSPKCGNGNQFLDKGAALRLGRALAGSIEAGAATVLEA